MTDGLEEIGLPPLGHNKPPEATALDRAPDLLANCNRWLAERQTISDAEMAGAAQRFTIQLRALRDDMGNDLRRERRPHDDAIEAIKERYRDPEALVKIALFNMERLNREWLKREQDRLDAERDQRERQADAAIVEAAKADQAAQQPGASVETQLAAERANEAASEAVEAVDKVPTRARTRDDYAEKAMSLRSNWKAKVVDSDKAIAYFADDMDVRPKMIAAIEAKASRLAKAQKGRGPIPPGVAFYNDERAQ